MHFGFVLKLSDTDLWNIDLLDTDLNLLDRDILSNYFVCLHSVFKTSSRYVFKTSSRPVFKRPSRRLARCLQDQQMFAGNPVYENSSKILTITYSHSLNSFLIYMYIYIYILYIYIYKKGICIYIYISYIYIVVLKAVKL